MRTFIALDLDEAIKRRLDDIEKRLRPHCPPLKWVNPRQMHLTLKFLGEIREEQIVPIQQGLKELAKRCRRFEITVESLGTFNPAGPVKVLWVGVAEPTGQLNQCHAWCEELLEPLGFPPEGRRFSPHLTLARNNLLHNSSKIRAALASEPPFHAGTQAVEGVTFYQSTLTPQGPIYQTLSRHAFGE